MIHLPLQQGVLLQPLNAFQQAVRQLQSHSSCQLEILFKPRQCAEHATKGLSTVLRIISNYDVLVM